MNTVNSKAFINKIKPTIAIFFVLFFLYGLVSKSIGIISVIEELFFTLFSVLFFTLPIIAIFQTENIFAKIGYFIWGLVLLYVSLFVFEDIQIMTTRFYYHTQNHITIHNLKTEDVSFIAFDRLTLVEQEQIAPIIEALNDSKWYSPNHEIRGKDVPMVIVLKTGERIYFRISRFYNEDSAEIIFVRPRENGFWVDGQNYAPKLPSTIQTLGYTLP